MKFSLGYNVFVDDKAVDAAELSTHFNTYRGALSDVASLEGVLVVQIEGEKLPADYQEPLVRLVQIWLSKLPWVIGGDTEAVALRNSTECFAFVPTGDGVEFSFYAGDESAVEEYIVEPTIVRLDLFIEQSLQLGEQLVQLVQSIDPEAFGKHEDCRDLKSSLEEAKKAWKTFQLHNRR